MERMSSIEPGCTSYAAPKETMDATIPSEATPSLAAEPSASGVTHTCVDVVEPPKKRRRKLEALNSTETSAGSETTKPDHDFPRSASDPVSGFDFDRVCGKPCLWLAPMVGQSETAFRMLTRRYGE